MLLAGLVVEQRLSRERFLDDSNRDRFDPRGLRKVARELERR